MTVVSTDSHIESNNIIDLKLDAISAKMEGRFAVQDEKLNQILGVSEKVRAVEQKQEALLQQQDAMDTRLSTVEHNQASEKEVRQTNRASRWQTVLVIIAIPASLVAITVLNKEWTQPPVIQVISPEPGSTSAP